MTNLNPRDPDLSHVSSSDFSYVYEPGDDTFLLMSALDDTLHPPSSSTNKAGIILEIGVGTGVVGAHASNLYSIRSAGQHGPCPSILLGTDINIRAARISNMTYQKNKVLGNAILGDLVSPIYQRLRGEIDVLIFNPPYVPSPVDEMEFRENDPLPVSWAGGRDGREVLDRVLHEIPKLLSPAGVFYLVVIEDNKPEELKKILLESGLSVQVVKQKISFREKLYIFLCTQAR